MPQYFFHSDDRNGEAADAPGIDLPDDDTAICEAGRSAGQMLADDLSAGLLLVQSSVRVESDDHRIVAIVSVTAKVERFVSKDVTV